MKKVAFRSAKVRSMKPYFREAKGDSSLGHVADKELQTLTETLQTVRQKIYDDGA